MLIGVNLFVSGYFKTEKDKIVSNFTKAKSCEKWPEIIVVNQFASGYFKNWKGQDC